MWVFISGHRERYFSLKIWVLLQPWEILYFYFIPVSVLLSLIFLSGTFIGLMMGHLDESSLCRISSLIFLGGRCLSYFLRSFLNYISQNLYWCLFFGSNILQCHFLALWPSPLLTPLCGQSRFTMKQEIPHLSSRNCRVFEVGKVKLGYNQQAVLWKLFWLNRSRKTGIGISMIP